MREVRAAAMSYPLPPKRRARLSDFEIQSLLGEGGLALVSVAVDRTTGERVALKAHDRKYLKSNSKEADVAMEEHCLRRANHPGIVKMYASFRDVDMDYHVLELLWKELWERVKGVGLSHAVAQHYLAQVLEAVAYLQAAQIVHRDLKAENVMISYTGSAKLIDFGTAKDLANPHIKGSGTKGFKKVQEDHVGTLNFMAPEVVKNKASDWRSDLWSFGCTVYQVHAGMPPFNGGSQYRVLKLATRARLDMPPGMDGLALDLIRKMLAVKPDDRLGAADIAEVRAHRYFAELPSSVGRRFGRAHRVAAPVFSLEECCLRHIGFNWERLGPSALLSAARSGGRPRQGARDALARMEEVAAIVGGRDRGDTSVSASDDEKRNGADR